MLMYRCMSTPVLAVSHSRPVVRSPLLLPSPVGADYAAAWPSHQQRSVRKSAREKKRNLHERDDRGSMRSGS